MFSRHRADTSAVTQEARQRRVSPVTQPSSHASLRSGALLTVLFAFGLALFLLTSGARLVPVRAEIVMSGSMDPAIQTGSLIFVKRVPAEKVQIGDVISFNLPGRPGKMDTHRVAGFEDGPTGRVFITKGDANPAPDPWRVSAAGEGWRYSAGVPYVGYVLTAFRSVPTRLALVVLPVLIGGLSILWRIWMPAGPPQLGRGGGRSVSHPLQLLRDLNSGAGDGQSPVPAGSFFWRGMKAQRGFSRTQRARHGDPPQYMNAA